MNGILRSDYVMVTKCNVVVAMLLLVTADSEC